MPVHSAAPGRLPKGETNGPSSLAPAGAGACPRCFRLRTDQRNNGFLLPVDLQILSRIFRA